MTVALQALRHAPSNAGETLETKAALPLSVRPASPEPGFRFSATHLYDSHTEARVLPGQSPAIESEQDLVVQLCRMPIDLAAPLLRSSLPALDAPALLALIAATGEAHHKLVARRPALDWRVIKALIKSNSDEVLLALAENPSLDFDTEDQAALARLAEDRVMLRAAILANPAFSRIRTDLKLNADDGLNHSNLRLVKLLRAGQIDRFIIDAARRLEVEPTFLSRRLRGVSATPLALMSCALGLDRAVFLNLLPYWQTAHGGAPAVNTAHKALILSVFELTPDVARQKLTAIA